MTEEKKIEFSFQETVPNTKSFGSRLAHFMDVTDPKYFFVSDAEITKGVKTVQKFK